MADNGNGDLAPMETRGINVNFRPRGEVWHVEITPNPRTMSEAFRPLWRAVFEVESLPSNVVFTQGQMFSALACILEDIAAEKLDPIVHLQAL